MKPRLILRDDGMSYGDYPGLRRGRLPQLTYVAITRATHEAFLTDSRTSALVERLVA